MRVKPAEVLDARKSAGLTQAQAARLVHLSSGLRWSEYERGERSPDPARWELFLLLTNQHPRLRVVSSSFAEALQSPLVLLDRSDTHADHAGGPRRGACRARSASQVRTACGIVVDGLL